MTESLANVLKALEAVTAEMLRADVPLEVMAGLCRHRASLFQRLEEHPDFGAAAPEDLQRILQMGTEAQSRAAALRSGVLRQMAEVEPCARLLREVAGTISQPERGLSLEA